ncbi:MAG: DUF1553 domain-containing protein [Pirellulaceae bacterium]
MLTATGASWAAEPAPTPAKLPPAAERKVDFQRDIEPIFANHCNHCHGPDEQQGYLRLDARGVVLRGGQSGPLLAAGKSAESLLVQRLAGLGTEKRMPLEDDPLTDQQIGLIRAWIDQGAAWPDGVGSPATEVNKHWAYVAPKAPPLPTVANRAWPQSPLDTFILARLEKEELAPSPKANRERLIRRASLDLVGLPPSVADVDAFLADDAPDAYQRLIDRLLASPRYGERWATPWLDAARYADSNGYQRDGHRTIWPYRDYVIRSLNADLPFDQFTLEQLAGDLLPAATLDQQIATGFQRCTTVNVEAGTDEEENRTNQVIDRVNVMGTVWLGTTLECCQCHNHKYDPFSQRDYYRLFAFFNNSPKETRTLKKGSVALEFAGPEVQLAESDDRREEREALLAESKELAAQLDACVENEATGLAAWEEEMADEAKAKQTKLPANIRRILARAADKRNKKQQKQLRTYFVGLRPAAKKMQAEITRLERETAALALPTSLVMDELDEPRMTALFQRGSFLTPGETVTAGTPRILPPMASDSPQNRLGLARWLVDPANPLTARVQVNRAWAQFFGRGIVASEEDFGTQSEPATHPDLLDWLAVELAGRGWSRKLVHRRIVQSATYQQASDVRDELLTKDPNNLLLARAPRLRLSAEAIRDNALTIGGQLSTKMHGPPVYPPQPEGIWRVTGNVDNTYRASSGADAHRRGLYTVWRRSALYPSFSNFDAPDRSACTTSRPRTSTPLQALTLQNDPVYVAAAGSLADALLAAGSPCECDADQRLTHAFRAALARRPTAVELAQLRSILDQACERYAADPQAAKELVGKHELPANVNPADWSAWFNVAHVLLNLDETITKN